MASPRSISTMATVWLVMSAAGCSAIVHRPGALSITTDVALGASAVMMASPGSCGGVPCEGSYVSALPLALALVTGIAAMIVDSPARESAAPVGEPPVAERPSGRQGAGELTDLLEAARRHARGDRCDLVDDTLAQVHAHQPAQRARFGTDPEVASCRGAPTRQRHDARRAARAGDCVAARRLAGALEASHPEYFTGHVASDPEILPCLGVAR